MSGCGDSKTLLHSSSWGWKDVTVGFKADEAMTPIIEQWRVWRITKDNRLVCEIVLPPDISACDALVYAGEMELLIDQVPIP